ncbi:MAG: M18 family aminopeptidase, partial [Muribaculaceae bacterium]|nr:M18 family aminopeptidase [Muribaculaceae bacterium]
PNYNEKYDPTNHPVIGGGPVVKINANCKYMTDGFSAAVFRSLCDEAGVSCQYFVNHSDVAGGSTLGNISSSQIDMPGVDMGCAIWAMHSARETAGVSDHQDAVRLFKHFFS